MIVAGERGVFFNAGTIIAGILGIIFGAYLRDKLKRPAYLFIAASAALVGVGIFHTKFVASQLLFGFYYSRFEAMHVVSALVFFLLSAFFLVLTGRLVSRKSNIGYFAVAAGILPLFFIIFQSPVWEHLSVLVINVAVFAIAFYLRKMGPL